MNKLTPQDVVKLLSKPAAEMADEDYGWVVGALLLVYANQTADEQEAGAVRHQNGMGFNGLDSAILTDMAKFYLSRKFLSKKQLEFIRRTLVKYHGQIGERTARWMDPGFVVAPKVAAPAQPEAAIARMVDDKLVISFPMGDKFQERLAAVKAIPSRRFNSTTKAWTATASVMVVKQLMDKGVFALDKSVTDWYEHHTNVAFKPIENIPGFKVTPRPYQIEGVAFAQHKNLRCIIGDDMGLGKTIQALGILQNNPGVRPAFIVCPASLKLNWLAELDKCCTGITAQVLSGRPKGPVRLYGDVVIVNYDILTDWKTIIIQTIEEAKGQGKAPIMICDEMHYTKNAKAARSATCIEIAKHAPHVVGLTGTLLENRTVEAYVPLSIVNPKLFPSFNAFAKRYCNATLGPWGWDYSGASNLDELHQIIKTVMIRRLKSEVLTELPPKQRSVVPLELDNEPEYKLAERDFIHWLAGIDPTKVGSALRAEAIVRISRLRRLAAQGKVKQAIAWAKDFLGNDQKIVVFTWHIEVLEALQAALKDFNPVVVHGGTPNTKRFENTKRFQEDPECKVFLGQIKAAGVGLTLTAASNVAFIEMGWTPGQMVQAEDRIHRISQEAESVNVWYLLAKGTIDDYFAALISEKAVTVDHVLDGKVPVNEDEEPEEGLLQTILTRYKEAA